MAVLIALVVSLWRVRAELDELVLRLEEAQTHLRQIQSASIMQPPAPCEPVPHKLIHAIEDRLVAGGAVNTAGARPSPSRESYWELAAIIEGSRPDGGKKVGVWGTPSLQGTGDELSALDETARTLFGATGANPEATAESGVTSPRQRWPAIECVGYDALSER